MYSTIVSSVQLICRLLLFFDHVSDCCHSFVCGMKIYFNLNSQEDEKIEVFSQETYSFQILGNEAIIIAVSEM